jgi:hypothetical protein
MGKNGRKAFKAELQKVERATTKTQRMIIRPGHRNRYGSKDVTERIRKYESC